MIALWSASAQTSSESNLDLEQSLYSVDASRMLASCRAFPFERSIDGTEIVDIQKDVYDPSFFLPFLVHVFSDHSKQHDMHRLLETNLVGMVIMGLASQNDSMRKVAHWTLCSIYDHLKFSVAKEKNQVLVLLEGLRDALVDSAENPFPAIPPMIALFFAQGLGILMKPESEFYPLINRFCLQRAQLDIYDVPMFYDLLYSATENHRKDKIWILRLLLNGLKSPKVSLQNS